MKYPSKIVLEYAQFVLTRVFGTGVETCVLWVCSRILFPPGYFYEYILSPIIGFEIAVMSNFLFSYFWIWSKRITRKSGADFWSRFLIFNGASVAGFLAKMVFLLAFERLFRWNVEWCNLAALLISGLLNFFLADTLVFRKSKEMAQKSSE